jgi:hypothetical protein
MTGNLMRTVSLSDLLNSAASAKENGDFKKLLEAQRDLRRCMMQEKNPEVFTIMAVKLLDYSEALTQNPDYVVAGLDGCMHLAECANSFDEVGIRELKYKAVDLVFNHVEIDHVEPSVLKNLYVYIIRQGSSETASKAAVALTTILESTNNDSSGSCLRLTPNA